MLYTAHPIWEVCPPLGIRLCQKYRFIFKTKSSNHTYLSTYGYLILFCVNTRHPYYSMCCGSAAGLTSQTGSFIRLWPSWATDPLWGSPGSGCDLFGQNGYFPVVSFLDRQSEILLGNSDRSTSSVLCRTPPAIYEWMR